MTITAQQVETWERETSDLRKALSQARTNGWNDALRASVNALPSTAENPNEDSYQRGRFDGVMEYQRAIARLYKDHGN